MRSDSEARHPAPAGLPDRLIRSQLEKVLSSEIFARSERLSGFLRFVVEHTLDGYGESLKEQVLAAEVYGKRTGFNAAEDPAVRNDARRLRDKLREYYAQFPHDPVVISLPKGGYTPVFERNASAPVPAIVPKPEPAAPRPRRRALAVAVGFAAIAACLAIWIWLRPMSAPEVWRPIPVSVLPGVEGAPSLSPDGNLVAFHWTGSDQPGQTDIYVKAIGIEELRRLTNTPVSEATPAWSPDGTQIAFVRAGQGVFVMSQLGGSERKLSDTGTNPAWSPDGRSVLIRDSLGNRSAGIFQVSLDTFERRQLTQPSSGASDWQFDVSPDGKTLAFIRSAVPGAADVYVVSMHGGKPQRRTNWNGTFGSVIWTPDGRDLIFNVGYGWPLSLWRVPADGPRPERGYRIALPIAANSPSISRPGPGHAARLAFLKVYHDVSLRLIDLGAVRSGEVIQAVEPFCDSTLVDYPGSFSRDATRVAFTSERSGMAATGGADQLWVAGRDCSGLRRLTSLISPATRYPAWSPDGRRIAFASTVEGNADLYVIGVDGGQPRRLLPDASTERFPDWSQDGRWIYFSSDRTGREEIWKIPAGGGQPVQITRNGGIEPIESLDGKSVYYLGLPAPGQPHRLKQVAVDGGDETVVFEGILPRHWAVTDKGIFFMTPEREFDWINLCHLPERTVTRVGRLPFRVARIGTIGRLTVSRDARWALANHIDRWDSDIMVIDNFR
jgi:Tol biopolymer transport system component